MKTKISVFHGCSSDYTSVTIEHGEKVTVIEMPKISFSQYLDKAIKTHPHTVTVTLSYIEITLEV